MTNETNQLLEAMKQAIAAREPVAILVAGDADPLLNGWRAATPWAWLDAGPVTEQDRHCPFGLWVPLLATHARGTALAERLRHGPGDPDDADFPFFADPLSVYQQISDWFHQIGEPLTVVLRAVDQTDEDSLRALSYLVRSLDDCPVAIVLQAAPEASPAWEGIVAELAEAVPLLRTSAPTAMVPSQSGDQPLPPIERIRDWLHAGAVYTGAQLLSRALAPEQLSALSPAVQATAWLDLARAFFMLAAYSRAKHAAYQVSCHQPLPQVRRLARRVAILSARQLLSEDLRSLAADARREIQDDPGSLTQPEVNWLRLDVALGHAMDDPDGECRRQLEAVIAAAPGEASAQCRAAAHLWLASVHVLSGRDDLATPHQLQGLKLLESQSDRSRTLLIRLRLGASLDGMGRFAEAATHFERAFREALPAGMAELAAMAWAEAVAAHARAGQTDRAASLLSAVPRTVSRLFSTATTSLLRLRAEAALAVARGDLEAAEARVNDLLDGLEKLPTAHAALTVHLSAQGAYLLSDIARSRGDFTKAAEWADGGLNLVPYAEREERPRLLGNGRQRLAALTSP